MKEQEQRPLLLGEISVEVEVEPNENAEDNTEDNPKTVSIISIADLINPRSNNIEIPDNILISSANDEINRLKQKEAIQKYQIQEKENELKRIKKEKQLLKQQQLQMRKLNNAASKQSSDISMINTNYVKNYALKPNQINDEPFIKKKQSQIIKKENENRIKEQNRADILYGSDEEYKKKYNIEKYGTDSLKFQTQLQNVPDISNSEKMFFEQKTLADMPIKKEYSLVDPKSKEIQDRNEKLEQGYEKHKLENIIAVDYIQKPSIKYFAINHTGIEAAENLHMSKAEYYLNTDYAKQHLIFNNYLELNSELQPYFRDKIISQTGKDKLLTTKGIYIDANSDSSKAMADVLVKNKKFIEEIIKNKFKIRNEILFDTSINFTDKNFHYALGNVDIKDIHLNKQGDLDILVTDIYDFNEGEKNDLVRLGRERQVKGEIIPYFILYHVIIPSKKIKAR